MRDRTIKLRDGRNLGFAEYGLPGAIPLLLFHGTPGSRAFPRFENAAWLKTFGLHVITPERPGFGLSDPQPARKIADWATDIEQLVDQLGIHRFHVAGGSGGGPYALACAIHSPTRVLSASLFSSGMPPEVMRSTKGMQSGNRFAFFAARRAPALLKLLSSMAASSIKKHPEKYLGKILSQLPESDRSLVQQQGVETALMQLTEAYRQGGDGAYRDMLLVSRCWQLDLEKIQVPVFLWHGVADTAIPVSAARAFSERLPGCESHFIPGAGHQLLGNEEVRSQIFNRMLSVTG